MRELPDAREEEIIMAMCRAHDREEAAQVGEPSPWAIEDLDPDWQQGRFFAMREAYDVCRAALWQPIATAPKDGTKILVFTVHGDIELSEWFETWLDRYEPVGEGLFQKLRDLSFAGWNSNTPTHWTPLPAPPKARP